MKRILTASRMKRCDSYTIDTLGVPSRELMGRAAKYFDIPYDSWIAAIEKTVAPKFVEMNKKAFEMGYNS